MSDEYIIEVNDVKKRYQLGVIGTGSLANDLKSWRARRKGLEDPNSKIGEKRLQGDTFYALNGVSLKVKKGEAVGIIGSNGAGKSTLLKILSRVTSPTEGEVTLRGRVTSMLEVGTGFNGELTGRENIYLNGAILGMTTKEIDAKMQDIIDFSECGDFIDTPVKRYSSGMYVKLAFSVAANLDNDIMIMDEVLAVGDMAFQRKCINKMIDTIHDDQKTVLYVSHNMSTVEALCNRVIVLNEGRVIFDGDPQEGIAIYSGVNKEKFLEREFTENDLTSYSIYTKNVKLMNRDNLELNAGDTLKLRMEWGSNTASGDIMIGGIISRGNLPIKTSFTKPFVVHPGEKYVSDFAFDTSGLEEGSYNIRLTFCNYAEPDPISFYMQNDFFFFDINANSDQGKIRWRDDRWGSNVGATLTMENQ